MSLKDSEGYQINDESFQNVTATRGSRLTMTGNVDNTRKEMEEDEDPLVVSLRRKLASTVEDLEEIYSAGLTAKEDKSTAPVFLVMHKATSKLYDRFTSLYDELIDVSGSSSISDEDKRLRTRTKTLFYNINLQAENLNSALQTESTGELNQTSGFTKSRAKLPTIELIPFNGQCTQWPGFRDTFLSLVINNSELTQMDKFHYLVTSLRDSARATIAHVSLVAENFPIAWETLLKTYNNQRKLASAYLDQLVNLKPLSFKPSTQQLSSFINQVNDSVEAFKKFEIEDKTDFLLFFLAHRCLDEHTGEAFELQQDSSKFPTLDNLLSYLQQRCNAKDLATGSRTPTTVSDFSKRSFNKQFQQHRPKYINQNKYFNKDKFSLMVAPSPSNQDSSPNPCSPVDTRGTKYNSNQGSPYQACPACTDRHPVAKCPRFYNMTIGERIKTLENWRGCHNCLYPSHPTRKCKVRGRCKFCKSGNHHTLLHRPSSFSTRPNTSSSTVQGTPGTSVQTLSATTSKVAQVILGTAVCSIIDPQGQPHTIRLVIDSGSQFSFLTRQMSEKIGLPVKHCNIDILGIGQTPFLGFRGKTHCKLVSHIEPVEVSTHALVVDTITSDLPSLPIADTLRRPYKRYNLADPNFGEPHEVDFLLGGDLFSDILTGDIVSFEPGQPKLIGTIFGFVAMGRISDISEARRAQVLCVNTRSNQVDRAALLEDLEKLWELDEAPSVDLSSPEDIACEKYFQQTHYRLSTGRYVVRLPFKGDRPRFPSTRWLAIKRLSNIEHKLVRDIKLRGLYQDFMQEYQALGHMCKAPKIGEYLIPHHGVFKASGEEAKIRVVFDASARTSIGSLNDFLSTGPKLQNNIVQILLNFRRHRIVFTVDLVKMFRQVLVNPLDRGFQHILWRFSPEEPVEEYELCTITYGQAPAPYLAIRTVKQLVIDEGKNFPLAARAIEEDMYVDDLATGADSVEEALKLQSQVIDIFAKGEFPLSKWSSNHQTLLTAVEDHQSAEAHQPKVIENPEDRTRIKILGLQWDPVADSFSYEVAPPDLIFTKRALLSSVSRIYDPLGLLSPLVIEAKALIQTSWKLGLGWDEQLPQHLREKWSSFVSQLPRLAHLKIPRWVCPLKNPSYEVLIFGDASELAYCAAAYLRVSNGSDVSTHLLLSKAKLAPVKPVSIPRLELCAALLATRILEQIFNLISRLPGTVNIRLFSDSTVTLGWLLTPAYQLKTFVANRVTRILEVTSLEQWSHVRSPDNPSDIGSRGLNADLLLQSDLWFKGPKWLSLEPYLWPITPITELRSAVDELPERKGAPVLVTAPQEKPYLLNIMMESSSYIHVLRKFAWILRFLGNARKVKIDRQSGDLTSPEIHKALLLCCRLTQECDFNHNKPLDSKTQIKNLLPLAPFLGEEGVLRVGGRVSAVSLPSSRIHPIILPANSHLTSLIINHYHNLLLHPGPSLLLSVIRRKFWIVGARNKIRSYTRNCVKCRRFNAKPCQPIMADLPSQRLEGGRAFLNVGIDIGGPFLIRDSLRRKAATSKAYMCLFVCLGSKAIHIEAVSSISTPAFLAALDRFISRRGIPSLIMSDNGTNFVGAANTLYQWNDWYRKTQTQTSLLRYAAIRDIEWRFTPPYAPHFGGIWEAGIRSAKRLIRAAYGEGVFTFEELATLFTKAEAILNSRPIAPLTSDPDDLDALTPGHLIIGTSLVGLPEPSLTDRKEAGLDRWKVVIQKTQFFWHRWKAECLQELQTRSKWRKPQRNLQTNDLVLIQGEESDRLKWPLGRIVEVLPGKDGVVRVATVRTQKGIFRRPAVKVIPIIIMSEDNSNQIKEVMPEKKPNLPPTNYFLT